MIIVVGFAVVVASVPMLGGSLTELSTLDLRARWLALVAVVMQVLLISAFAPHLRAWHAELLHLATYAVAAVFFWLNRSVRGMLVIGVGGAMNLLAIAANAGVMPASAWAVRTAGLSTNSTTFENSQLMHNPRLLLLGDIFAVPAHVPFANVFSLGDVVLLAGSMLMLHSAARSRPFRRMGGRWDLGAARSQPSDATLTGMPLSTEVPDNGSMAS